MGRGAQVSGVGHVSGSGRPGARPTRPACASFPCALSRGAGVRPSPEASGTPFSSCLPPVSLSLQCFSYALFFIHTFINTHLLSLYCVHVGLSPFSPYHRVYLAPLPCPWPPPRVAPLACACASLGRPPHLSLSPSLSVFTPFPFRLGFWIPLFLGASLPLPGISVDPGSAGLASRRASRSHWVSVCLAFGGALALLRRCRSINLRRRCCRREEGRDVGCANSLPPDASK